ncbi:AraC family transcriptional regulator [Larkinella harenae]
MDKRHVNCASLIDQTTTSFILYHQHLGCFHSDWHQHEWEQLIYAEQGCIHLNGQGKVILIPRGFGVWIPANTEHEIWSDSPQLHMRSLCFPLTPSSAPVTPSIAVFPVTVLLREMIRYTEKWSQSDQDNAQATTFLRAIHDLLPGEVEKAIPVYFPSTTYPRLVPILIYIQSHLSEPLNFQWIAREFGLSGRTLSRLFTQHLGISFMNYCKIARIMKAIELIEMGSENVSQLALDVGYESLATFSNNFLEICGHRPLHFIRGKRGG